MIGEASEIVGREEELTAISAFLEVPHPLPRALLIVGEAGIGKTTLWREAVSLAREYRVLTSRPVEAEARLSLAGLDDLLEGVHDEVLPQLPGPQARALRIALLLEEASGQPPSREPSLPRSSARYASWPASARCSSPSTTSSGSITPQPRSSASRPVAFATSQSGCSWHRGSRSRVTSFPCAAAGFR